MNLFFNKFKKKLILSKLGNTSFYLISSVTKNASSLSNQTSFSDKEPEKSNCRIINLNEKVEYRINEATSLFVLYAFFIDLANLASVLFGFKFQNLIFKFLKKTLIYKRLFNDYLDFESLKFLSIYIGLSIALLQFLFYLNLFLKFDTIKKMQIGKFDKCWLSAILSLSI